MIDIGINLMNKQFHQDREDVIASALTHGVQQMILTGTSVKTSVEAARFVENYAQTKPNVLYATAGIHPHDARHFTNKDTNVLASLLAQKHVVAVGECGLDFNRMHSSKEEQEACFIAQLELARQTGKPLFLHERDAHDRFLSIMNDYEDVIPRSIVHCFTGNTEEVQEYIEKGFYIGITGWICDDKRGKALQEAVKQIPLDRILIETDGPYLAPKNLSPRPKTWRNEPKYLPHIATWVAHYMDVPEETLIAATIATTKKVFNL